MACPTPRERPTQLRDNIACIGKKRKRCSYDVIFKLKVVNFAEIHGNRAAEREHSVSEKLVRDWRKQKDTLEKLPKKKRACRGKEAKFQELEQELVAWIVDQRSQGYTVSMMQIQLQAIRQRSDSTFKASIGWCQKFMRRHGLTIRQRTKLAQKLPADLDDKVTSFHKFILKLRYQYAFELSQIGNMDETPMWFDLPGNHTIDMKGNKTVLVKTTGHEKTHFTVVLGCMADGTKLKPMVIFKRKTLPKAEKFPAEVIVHAHPKGWMDEEGIFLWFNKVWDIRPGALFKKKALLVWDQFRAHKTEKVKDKVKSHNTLQAMIPGGLTSLLQPLDVVLNKPFKDRVRQRWMEYISSDQKEFTKGGNLKRPSLSLVTSWVKSAWNEIPTEMVKKSFLKTGISNKLDGTEDDNLWEEDHELSDSDSIEQEDDTRWDTDERITQEEWNELFGDSENEDEEFNGF